MGHLTSKADLARLAGVSRAAVTKAAQGALADAVTDGKIDISHPVVVEWLTSKATAPEPVEIRKASPRPAATIKQPANNTTTPTVSHKPSLELTGAGYDVTQLENLTIREVVMRYGSVEGFKRFVESLKSIAEYNFRELKIKTQRGELIQRDLVVGALLPLVDVAYQRLVSDVPAAIIQQVVARLESGGVDAVLDCEKIIRDAISKVLKSTKESIIQTEILQDGN